MPIDMNTTAVISREEIVPLSRILAEMETLSRSTLLETVFPSSVANLVWLDPHTAVGGDPDHASHTFCLEGHIFWPDHLDQSILYQRVEYHAASLMDALEYYDFLRHRSEYGSIIITPLGYFRLERTPSYLEAFVFMRISTTRALIRLPLSESLLIVP